MTRDHVLTLGTTTRRFHWRDARDMQRIRAVQLVAAIDAMHAVVVGSCIDPKKQERARACCLEELLVQLDGMGVDEVWLEAHTQAGNARDIGTVANLRRKQALSDTIRVDHGYPSTEPLLWLSDIVAGAVRMSEDGDPRYVEPFLARIARHDLEISGR